MKFLFSTLIFSFCIISPAWSAVLIAKHSGSGFAMVEKDQVESTCGSNFSFRDQHKSEIPGYLEPELIKKSFKGEKLYSSLESAKADAEKSGKCIWFTASEKASLGL